MSKQTFDPITRNIRTVETAARLVITSAESSIAAMRKKRAPTVTANQKVFDELGAVLRQVDQLHDNVVAHSHLVADNIATRSRTQVMNVRTELLEAANRMIELCTMAPLPKGVYDPRSAFATIADTLARDGYLTVDPKYTTIAESKQRIGYLATYRLEKGYNFSVLVSVSTHTNLGEGSDEIVVSVWEDAIPPLWDNSYHKAAGFPLAVGFQKGKRLGLWTKQTDNALIDYVATVLSKEVKLATSNSPPPVPNTYRIDTNSYGTHLGRPKRVGSDKFDYEAHGTILNGSIESMTPGKKGELILRLNPQTINKSGLAAYVLSIMQLYTKTKLDAEVRFNREGYYELVFPSLANIVDDLNAILDGKW